MQKRIIAFDLDDVLMHFNAGFIAFHNRVYGTRVNYEDICTYDLGLVYGCENEVIRARIKAFYQSAEHASVEPFPGSLKAVDHLRKHHLLDIVTSRSEMVQECTRMWVEQFFPNSFRSLHFTNGFEAVNGTRKRHKSEVCAEIGAVVLIDDALNHAEEVARSNIPVLLPDRPWNREYTPKGVTRVSSWDEIISWIDMHV